MSAVPPCRVVVVEDSLVQRAHLVAVLRSDVALEVVGEAGTVEEALAVVERTRPDVVTMDLELPGMEREAAGRPGGLLAIEHLVAAHRLPILVLSSLTASRDATLAIDALAAGAVDVLPKPAAWDADAMDALRRRVRVCSRVELVGRRGAPRFAAATGARRRAPRPVVGLVASTGGPSALRVVVAALRGMDAPVLVVQHIHDAFASSFARWLEEETGVPTALAEDGEAPEAGTVLVAPPGAHLRLARNGRIELDDEPATLSTPSGDELLCSMAAHAGPDAVAAVLTGMGDDGARGLAAVAAAGGRTYVQDEATSIVHGMPRAALELGPVDGVLAVEELGEALRGAVEARLARPAG